MCGYDESRADDDDSDFFTAAVANNYLVNLWWGASRPQSLYNVRYDCVPPKLYCRRVLVCECASVNQFKD